MSEFVKRKGIKINRNEKKQWIKNLINFFLFIMKNFVLLQWLWNDNEKLEIVIIISFAMLERKKMTFFKQQQQKQQQQKKRMSRKIEIIKLSVFYVVYEYK